MEARRVGRGEVEKNMFFWVLSGLRGNAQGEGGEVRTTGRNRLGGMRLTFSAPLACMTLIEWRTSADAVGR